MLSTHLAAATAAVLTACLLLSTPAAAAATCAGTKDMRIFGGELIILRTVIAKDEAGCCDACTKYSDAQGRFCQAWNFFQDGKTCVMRGAKTLGINPPYINFGPMKGVTTGCVSTPATACTGHLGNVCRLHQNVELVGANEVTIKVASPEACCRACYKRQMTAGQNCDAWTYSLATKMCRIKKRGWRYTKATPSKRLVSSCQGDSCKPGAPPSCVVLGGRCQHSSHPGFLPTDCCDPTEFRCNAALRCVKCTPDGDPCPKSPGTCCGYCTGEICETTPY